jgi:CBS domain containing-hemolysin-like protein
MIINVFVITFIILLISEIIPKVASSKKPKHFAIAAAYPLTFFYFLFYPLSSFFYALTHGLSGLLKFEKDKYLLSDAELRTLVDVGQEKGALHADERDMIHSIFEMSETMVREIMVPRTDMIVISDDSTLTHVLNTVKDRLHSRIPVYSETIDEIIGILFIKDLLPLIKRRTTSEIDLKKLVHPAYFVPEQKKINELLREFQKEKIHMAIVVDEYGGTSGLVTLEDVIEEIVGEIQDEYDTEQPLIVKLSPEKFLLDAGVSMDELNDELEIQLPCEENTDTLAGFLLGQFGSVPKVKESVRWENYLFTIIKVSNRRIQQVEMRIEEKVNESR